MAEISKITDIGGTTYDLKDATARAAMIPSGGSAGQALVKNSAANYDVKWTKIGGGGEPNGATIALGTSWTDSGNGYYTSTPTVSGVTVTARSKIDLQPTAANILALKNQGVTMIYIENDNGTLTAYAFGAGLTTAVTLQCTVTEVV